MLVMLLGGKSLLSAYLKTQIHRSRKKNITNPMYPSPRFNNYQLKQRGFLSYYFVFLIALCVPDGTRMDATRLPTLLHRSA